VIVLFYTNVYDSAGRLTSVTLGTSCTCDDAGWLTTITQPGLSTENYTWYADGTLATLPGNGGTRTLEYDEEGRNTAIKYGSTVKFEFGYAYDGARRWTKDIAANKWTWYPCGVACSAGELVEMSSDLTGATWTTTSTSLTTGGCGTSLIRSDALFVVNDSRGNVTTITGANADTIATTVYDANGVRRAGSGSLTPGVIRAIYGSGNEDSMGSFSNARFQPRDVIDWIKGIIWPRPKPTPGPKDGPKELCKTVCKTLVCGGLAGAAKKICVKACEANCNDLSPGVQDATPIYRTCNAAGASCDSCCVDLCGKTYDGLMEGMCIRNCQNGCLE